MKKLALYVFIDAFGWEVYKRYGFLEKRLNHSKKLESIFGFSSACDPSILTGRYPNEHTHWSSFYWDPKNSPFKMMKLLSFLPKRIFDRWRVRHNLSKLISKWHGYTGYFEIYSVPFSVLPNFDYLEKNDYFVPKGILKTDTIFDYCYDNKIPYHCSNWRLPEEENIKIAIDEIKKSEDELLYLYLPKLDAVMHEYGNEHEKVKEKLLWLEEQIESVVKEAEKKYDDVSLYILGDHGMTNVIKDFDLIAEIETLGLKYGKDYSAMYDSTMARFWFFNDEAKKRVEEKLNSIEDGYIVAKEELQEMNVYFEDGKFGELFFLVNPGVLIVPSYFGLNSIKGMHGYHPHDKDSYPLFASNKEIPDEISCITDIRKTMEYEITHHG